MQIKKLTSVKMIVAVISPLLFFSNSVQAEDAPSTTIKRLTMESANAAALATIEACRKEGVQITATVVDKNGLVQAVMRDTLAPHVSIDISRMKAYTAVNFSTDTSALISRSDTSIGRIDGLVMSAGGAIINVGGTIYGAVGVSGAPSGETDEKCAKAGVAAIAEDLEMAD